MVLRGGRQYRKSSQKGRNGGKTRRQQVAEKIRQHQRYLRENGLAELIFDSNPAEKARCDTNTYPVFGVKRIGNEWVLFGMACTDRMEKISRRKGGGYSETKIRGRYVYPTANAVPITVRDGIELQRFDTKRAALEYVGADSSEKVEAGTYVIRPEHNPNRTKEQVDKEAFQAFRRTGRKVFE